MSKIENIESVSMLHGLIGLDKPKHPLVTVIDLTQARSSKEPRASDISFSFGFYAIVLKRFEGTLRYGRGYYDFDSGSLLFSAPNQVLSSSSDLHITEGWALYFHPDLLLGTTLAGLINTFTFFEYSANEALHLSEDEKKSLEICVRSIEAEYERPIDHHTQDLIVSQIDLLLKYSNRYYDRQFVTRRRLSNELISRFEKLLKSYFTGQNLAESGLPNVNQFAQELHVSPSYLTDTLHKLTGKSTQEYIHLELIQRAKSMLIGTNKTVSEIAFDLGFEYPSHFTKLFKSKTGIPPRDFRNLN